MSESHRLVTVNDVLIDTFPKAWKKIKDAVTNNERLNLLLKAPMGCRKSSTADKWAVELAAQGKNVIIAAPTGKLAKEHIDRIRALGGDVHSLGSHKAIFQGKEYECPDYHEIQYYNDLGVDSRYYKKKFCSNCPFFDTCSYPRQYATALEEDQHIIIIQHAHFKCKETMFQLLQNKDFSVMIIDESFIDNLIEVIKPTDFEIEVLKITTTNSKWTEKLSDWLKIGGEPKGTLRPIPEELEELYQIFDDNNQGWRMKSLIDAYNSGQWLHAISGIKSFSPVSDIKVLVLTDATPTEEELRIVLNTSHIEVVGHGDVLDIRKYHPENKIIQVLDSSLSKSSLLKDEKFYDYLSFIGDKCTSEFIEDKVLITTFKDNEQFPWTQETLTFFQEKYPHLDVGIDPMVNRIVVDGMRVGVNTYASFSVQFLVCSVYMNSTQIAEAAYQTKVIKNYWRNKENLPLVQNILPKAVQSSPTIKIPVKKIQPDGVFEYPDFLLHVPEEKYERMAYDKAVGKSQQAIRIRFTENLDRRKRVYIFGNYNFPSLLITDVVLFEDIIAELN